MGNRSESSSYTSIEPSDLGFRLLKAAEQQLQSVGVELAYGALPTQY
jgi:hypothetical protein